MKTRNRASIIAENAVGAFLLKKSIDDIVKNHSKVSRYADAALSSPRGRLIPPGSLRRLLTKVPRLGVALKAAGLMSVAAKAYKEGGIPGLLSAVKGTAVYMLPIIGEIAAIYDLSQAAIAAMKKYVDYEKGIIATVKQANVNPLDPDRIRDAEASGKYGNTVDDDYLKRLNMTLNESKKVKKPDSMKLIMENFKRAMNEQMGGIGMPLRKGVQTAAGKAAKAEEDKRNRAITHNFHFIRKLRSMGNEPDFIEIEPGDVMGIHGTSLPMTVLLEILVIEGRLTSDGGPLAADNIVTFGITPEGNLTRMAPRFEGPDRVSATDRPMKISPRYLAGFLERGLEKEGLYAKLYLKRPNTADPVDMPKSGI